MLAVGSGGAAGEFAALDAAGTLATLVAAGGVEAGGALATGSGRVVETGSGAAGGAAGAVLDAQPTAESTAIEPRATASDD